MASFDCREEEENVKEYCTTVFDGLFESKKVEEYFTNEKCLSRAFDLPFLHSLPYEEKKKLLEEKFESLKRSNYNLEGRLQQIVASNIHRFDAQTLQDLSFEERRKELEDELEQLERGMLSLKERIESYCLTSRLVEPYLAQAGNEELWCEFCQKSHPHNQIPYCVACNTLHNIRSKRFLHVAYVFRK